MSCDLHSDPTKAKKSRSCDKVRVSFSGRRIYIEAQKGIKKVTLRQFEEKAPAVQISIHKAINVIKIELKRDVDEKNYVTKNPHFTF